MHLVVLAVALAFSACFAPCQSGRILLLPMHMTGSHKKSFVPLGEALADSGHEVTFFDTFYEKMPIKSKKIIDVDLVTKTTSQIYNEQFVWHNGSDIMGAWNSGPIKPWNMFIVYFLGIDICKHGLDQYGPEFQKVIDTKWDLILVDNLFTPCGWVIAEQSKSPYIIVSSSLSMPVDVRHHGVPQPVDSLPINAIDYDYKNYWQRLKQVTMWQVYDLANARGLQWMHRLMLGSKFPWSFNWKDFSQKSLFLMEAFPWTFRGPFPVVTDYVGFGDAPCPAPPSTPLPEDYEKFVSDPKSKGSIVAAFGHIVNWKMTPMKDIMALHGAFEKLKDYRIIWQYNGPDLPPLANVKITGWLPQKELLYHPRTKVFLSHMGLKSTLEGVCAKLPFVALPVYAEQPLNARLVIKGRKIGTWIDKKALDSDDIYRKFMQVLTDPSFKERTEKLAAQMEDQPINPMVKSVFWINFSLRHQEHIRIVQIRGRFMNFAQYYNLDVIGLVAFGGYLALLFVKKGVVVTCCKNN